MASSRLQVDGYLPRLRQRLLPNWKSAMRSALLLIPLLFLPVLAVASGQGPAAPLDDAALLGAGFLDGHPDMKFRQWGMDALQRGDAEAAMDNFRKAARYADKPAQGLLGEMYWYGVKRAADPVMAFAWMDVAAERGYPLMLELRDKYWAALPLEQHDVARAQALRLRDEYGDAAARPRLAAELQRGKRAMTGSRTGSLSNNVDIVYMDGGVSRTIKADRLYDPTYWDPDRYQRWQDENWMKIRRGTVEVGLPTQTPPPAATEGKP